MSRLLLVLLMAAPFLARADDGEAQWRTIPYADLHAAFMEGFVEGTYLRSRPAFRVRGRGFSIEDLRIEIDAADGTIVVEIEDDGLAHFPLDPGLAAENPPVRTNAPRGGLGAAIRYSAEAEPVQSFSYSLVEDMTNEYRATVRSLGLMARLALPSPNGLLVAFDGPGAHARVLLPQPETLQADEQGYLLIPANRRWRQANPTIELSEPPRRIELAMD